MAFNRTLNGVRHRTSAQDRFYTPPCVVNTCVKMVTDFVNKNIENDVADMIWFEPFKGAGAFYNQFPCHQENKRWTEIDLGRNFLEFNEEVDIICTNPPFSILNEVFEKIVKLDAPIVLLLIGVMNLTKNRYHIMEDAGYKIVKIHFCDIKGWFGINQCVMWVKDELLDEDYDPPITHSGRNLIKKPDGSAYTHV